MGTRLQVEKKHEKKDKITKEKGMRPPSLRAPAISLARALTARDLHYEQYGPESGRRRERQRLASCRGPLPDLLVWSREEEHLAREVRQVHEVVRPCCVADRILLHAGGKVLVTVTAR